MGYQVVNGAMLTCSFGTAPGTLLVLPTNMVLAANMPAANIMDNKPFVNITGFVMCTSMANPAVASATAAALGVLTPMPCTPMTAAPWAPGASKVLIANMPALNDSSKCICSYGGNISISYAGQVQVQVT
jgi:hypothetical protein